MTCLSVWLVVFGVITVTHAHIARYISGLRDNMCIEEKKNRPLLAACDVAQASQLLETDDAPRTKIRFGSGRCLSRTGDLIPCERAGLFELSPYVWGMKVYVRISSNGTCLTNPKLLMTPCLAYPLENQSQLFVAFELGARLHDGALVDKDSDFAFNQSTFLTFNLQYSEAQQKAQMAVNPLSEAYLPSVIVVQYGTPDATLYDGVGLRYKGSMGSFGLCIDPVSKTINDVCRKLSLKIDTNKFIKKMKQSIFGLKKLVFNGMAIDYSLMAERVAFQAFQTMGVIAPRAVHASIYLNGNLSGIYIWVEAIDDVFTMYHFGDDNNKGRGGLYKDAWLRSTRPGDYTGQWAKGLDEDDFLAEVARAVVEASDAEAVALLETYFDTESIVNVTAMNAVLGMTDDWRWRHNFWWYVRDKSPPCGLSQLCARNKKLVMLPWDYDRTNDEAWLDRVKQGPWWEIWDPMDARCSVNQTSSTSDDPSTLWFLSLLDLMLPSDFSRPIQCDKLARMFAIALKSRVQARTQQFAEAITMDRIKGWMDAWSEQIRPVVAKEVGKPSVEEWTLAKAGLLFHYMTARAVAGFERVGPLTGGLNSLGLSLEALIRETGGDLQRLVTLGRPKITAAPTPARPTPLPTLPPTRAILPPSTQPTSPMVSFWLPPAAPSLPLFSPRAPTPAIPFASRPPPTFFPAVTPTPAVWTSAPTRPPTPLPPTFPQLINPAAFTPVVSSLYLVEPSGMRLTGPIRVPAGTAWTALGFPGGLPVAYGPVAYSPVAYGPLNLSTPISGLPAFSFPVVSVPLANPG